MDFYGGPILRLCASDSVGMCSLPSQISAMCHTLWQKKKKKNFEGIKLFLLASSINIEKVSVIIISTVCVGSSLFDKYVLKYNIFILYA